jgi:uncharacterized protein (DUF58 family)
MAESKRDPSVGKHWLGYWALQGDEDMQFVSEYVSHAKDMVRELIGDPPPLPGRNTQEELTGLLLFLIELELALAEEGSSEFKVQIKRRKPGKPINKLDRANAGHKAAAMVEKAAEAGMKTEAAIADAGDRTGLSRSEIFTWLRKRREDRERFAAIRATANAQRADAGLPPLDESGQSSE